MSNHQFLTALEKQRDDLFDFLNRQTISGLFKKEYQSMKDGSTILLGETDDNLLLELKNYSKDTSFDKAFKEKVQSVKHLDDASIINYFEDDIEKIFLFIAENKYEVELQALFVEYDFYNHFEGTVTGLGKQNYPLIEVPRYINAEIDFSKIIFNMPDGINFEAGWVDCEAFEWISSHLDIYYQLQKLFQLHSRVLLHKTLTVLDNNRVFQLLSVRPFTFYINEHDSEVMTMYRLD